MNHSRSIFATAIIAGLLTGAAGIAHAQTTGAGSTSPQDGSAPSAHKAAREHKSAAKDNSCKGDASGCPAMDMSAKGSTNQAGKATAATPSTDVK